MPPLVVTDDFNRADALTLGANWSNQASGSIDVVSNQAKATNDSTQAAFYSAVAFPNDQYSQIEAAIVATALSMGPTVRASVTGALYNHYVISWKASGAGQSLIKVIAGAGTLLQSITGNIAPGDIMYLAVAGTTLVCKKNGVALGTPQDDASLGSGSPGFRHVPGAGLDSALDDWEGGEVPAELQVLLGEPVVGASLF